MCCLPRPQAELLLRAETLSPNPAQARSQKGGEQLLLQPKGTRGDSPTKSLGHETRHRSYLLTLRHDLGVPIDPETEVSSF